MVQVNYDAKSDVLSIVLAPKKVKESTEILPDVIADFDDNGRVIAFEILDASKVIDPGTNPFEREAARVRLVTQRNGWQVNLRILPT